MNNFYEADAIESAPALTSLLSQGYPTEGNPSLGIPATKPGAAWFYMITTELINILKKAGVTPDVKKVDQLAQAIFASASTSKAGIVQLSSAINSASETTAATSKAVKQAYDLANTANNRDVSGVPTGILLPFGGTIIPSGYLLCNGAAVSRTTYAKLFSIIGTLWGSGDGETTFNLPDFSDKFIEGTTDTANVAKFLEAGLPNITGAFSRDFDYRLTKKTGCFASSEGGTNQINAAPGAHSDNRVVFDASLSSSIYSASETVQPASNQVLIIIKT